jgi:3-oxoacyl-[acyl-carrier-protein] synthase-3
MTTMLSAPIATGSRLMGFGAAQPEGVLTGAGLGAPFAKSAEWVRVRTGIESVRRIRQPQELAELAGRAAVQALDAAGVRGLDIDLVLSVSCSDDPTSGGQELLGRDIAPRAASARINAACSGFCYALGAADALIRTGAARHVLVVAAEHMSRLLDDADLDTSIIFGDGVGAAVVGPAATGRSGIGPTVSGSDGAQHELISCDLEPPTFLRMAGRQVFRWAIEETPALAREACRRAGVALSDIDVFVPHQANLRIIHALTTALGLDHAVVATDVSVSGNTSGASIPIALTRLVEQRLVASGQLALLLGFGAGLSYAAQVVELP